jgi:hypothetical protein
VSDSVRQQLIQRRGALSDAGPERARRRGRPVQLIDNLRKFVFVAWHSFSMTPDHRVGEYYSPA